MEEWPQKVILMSTHMLDLVIYALAWVDSTIKFENRFVLNFYCVYR